MEPQTPSELPTVLKQASGVPGLQPLVHPPQQSDSATDATSPPVNMSETPHKKLDAIQLPNESGPPAASLPGPLSPKPLTAKLEQQSETTSVTVGDWKLEGVGLPFPDAHCMHYPKAINTKSGLTVLPGYGIVCSPSTKRKYLRQDNLVAAIIISRTDQTGGRHAEIVIGRFNGAKWTLFRPVSLSLVATSHEAIEGEAAALLPAAVAAFSEEFTEEHRQKDAARAAAEAVHWHGLRSDPTAAHQTSGAPPAVTPAPAHPPPRRASRPNPSHRKVTPRATPTKRSAPERSPPPRTRKRQHREPSPDSSAADPPVATSPSLVRVQSQPEVNRLIQHGASAAAATAAATAAAAAAANTATFAPPAHTSVFIGLPATNVQPPQPNAPSFFAGMLEHMQMAAVQQQNQMLQQQLQEEQRRSSWQLQQYHQQQYQQQLHMLQYAYNQQSGLVQSSGAVAFAQPFAYGGPQHAPQLPRQPPAAFPAAADLADHPMPSVEHPAPGAHTAARGTASHGSVHVPD